MTLTDFLEEDRTRQLPPGERVMHALMGIAYGVFLALLYPQAAQWAKLDSGFGAENYGSASWFLTACAVGVFTSGIRDLVSKPAADTAPGFLSGRRNRLPHHYIKQFREVGQAVSPVGLLFPCECVSIAF